MLDGNICFMYLKKKDGFFFCIKFVAGNGKCRRTRAVNNDRNNTNQQNWRLTKVSSREGKRIKKNDIKALTISSIQLLNIKLLFCPLLTCIFHTLLSLKASLLACSFSKTGRGRQKNKNDSFFMDFPRNISYDFDEML